jgi:hypothetical protein
LYRFSTSPYVRKTPVLFPLQDRIFHSLLYAKRGTKGAEVFRDCRYASLGSGPIDVRVAI